MQSMTVQLDIDVTSSSNGQSEKTILDFEPVACGQHQLPSIWKPCGGFFYLAFRQLWSITVVLLIAHSL